MGCPSPEQLLGFVGGGAPVDPVVAEELEAHFAECAECRNAALLLARGSLADEARAVEDTGVDGSGVTVAGASPPSKSRALPRGTALGRYTILERIGQGGMGVVYAAYDPELDRRVALKLIRTDTKSASTILQTRLLREAQAMARLAHPNVVHVYDVGVLGAQVFVAMEWVEGGTLAEWLRVERPWREVLAMFVAAGRGLAAAHAAGLVHRDFKPDNVLIDKEGLPRVTDFGLARPAGALAPPSIDEDLVSPDSPLRSDLTATGAVLGTPGYMAPEQLRGEATDARADLFSFCVALYEALTGERPYHGTGAAELLAAIESGRPRRFSGAVPPQVQAAIGRGLSARPDERFDSMTALLDALTPAVRRRWYGVPLLVAAAAVASLGLGYRLATRPAPCRDAEAQLGGVWDAGQRAAVGERLRRGGPAAVAALATLDNYARDWRRMETESCQATRVRSEQSEELFDLRSQCLRQRRDELGAAAGALSQATDAELFRADRVLASLTPLPACADAAALRARTPLPRDPALRREVEDIERRLAEARPRKVLRGHSPVEVELAGAEDGAAARAYPPLRAALLVSHGSQAVDAGEFDAGLAMDQQAAAVALSCGDDEAFIRAAQQIAFVTGYHRERPDEAMTWLDLGFGVLQRLRGRQDLELSLLITRAQIDDVNQRLTDEEATLRRALPMAERSLGPNTMMLRQLIGLAGAVEAQHQRWDGAVAAYRRQIALAEQAGDREAIANGHYDLGLALDDARRYDDAIVEIKQALAIEHETLPPDHPNLANGMITLAECYVFTGQYALARELLGRALPIAEQRRQELPQGLPQARALLGQAEVGLGHPRAAIPLLQAALAPGVLDNAHQIANAKLALARAWLADGRGRARAVELATQARALYAAETPPAAESVAAADRWLAQH